MTLANRVLTVKRGASRKIELLAALPDMAFFHSPLARVWRIAIAHAGFSSACRGFFFSYQLVVFVLKGGTLPAN